MIKINPVIIILNRISEAIISKKRNSPKRALESKLASFVKAKIKTFINNKTSCEILNIRCH